MASAALPTYLNDHLAGSTAGVEIAEYLIEHSPNDEMRETLASVKEEIERDRAELQLLMKNLDIEESSVRKVAAWFTEKATELKLRFEDPSAGPFLLFEALEILSLGIEGKRGLWTVLSAASGNDQRLAIGADYDDLIRRAETQRAAIEALRLNTGRSILPQRVG